MHITFPSKINGIMFKLLRNQHSVIISLKQTNEKAMNRGKIKR